MSSINLTAHGLVGGERVVFSNIVPTGTGVDPDTVYTVLATGLTANSFQISETGDESDPLVFALDVTSADMAVVPETTTSDPDDPTYVAVSDVADVHAPPTDPPAPSSPSVATPSVSGLVRIQIVLAAYSDTAVRVRQHEYQVTHRYTDESALAGTITGTASTDTITKTAHGFSAGSTFRFKTLTGGTGINLEQTYYVLAAGLTADAFTFSTTAGGAAVDFTSDISTGTIASIVTPVPDWSYSTTLNLPVNATDITIPCLPNTAYAVRGRVEDVYGNHSDWCATVELTSPAGNDALYAAITDVANDVTDGIITETKIADNSITTAKIKANQITADLLATTMIISSLFTTGLSGARIEWDNSGIRMYNASNVLVVNLDVGTASASFTGDVTSANLISNNAATFYGTTTFPGDSTITLANGISAPSNAPTLSSSLDYLGLTSTPGDVSTARGIAYGTNSAGTAGYWIAADPTQSGGYVAHHFNTSGALTESIMATGSTTTYTTTNGSTAHVSDSAQARASADVQVATPIVSHATRANQKITKISFYAAGYSGGTPTVRGAVYNTSNTRLGYTASTTLTAKTFANGNSYQSNLTMTTPLSIAANTTYRVGWYQTSSEGIQWDRDDGSGKTQYRGDGGSGSLSIVETLTSNKPNVYYTYTYDVDTRLETLPNIAIAVDGTYIYTLDTSGVVWKYQRTTGAYVAKSAVLSLTGTYANNGMGYDATAGKLIIAHASGTTGTDHVKFSVVDPTTLTIDSTATDAVMFAIGGSTMTFHGVVRAADPLNSSTVMYWVPMGNGDVWPFKQSDGQAPTNYSSRTFGGAGSSGHGLTHDGTVFRGWDRTVPTKVWTFTDWDWTTESAVYWVGYAWYQTTGGYVTPVGPRASITMSRRSRMYVTNASLPSGVSHVRIYMNRGASDPGATGFKLQTTTTGTARYLSTFDTGGAADSSTSTFPAGTAATISDIGGKWVLKGDGTAKFGGTNGEAFKVGDDAAVHDVNTADTLNVRGQQTAANGKISFGSGNDTNIYRGGADSLMTDDDFGILGVAGSHGSGTSFTINNGGTATYSNKSYEWLKIGKIVVLHVAFTVVNAGSGTTAVTITNPGWPSPKGTSGIPGDKGGSGVYAIMGRLDTGGTFAAIRSVVDGGNLTGADLVAGSGVNLMGAFITA